MRTNTSSVVYRTLILVLGLIITSTLSSIGGTWSSTTSILRSSQHRRQVNIHPFRLYSSLISVPNEMPNESIHQNQSDSSSSSTRSSSGSTDRSSRSDFNLTGICSGDGFQCALPERGIALYFIPQSGCFQLEFIPIGEQTTILHYYRRVRIYIEQYLCRHA